jgi:hypothetical protein
MLTDYDELIGTNKISVSEAELLGAVSNASESDIYEAYTEEPEAMGFLLPAVIKKIRKAAALRKKLKKLPKAERKKVLRGIAKKAGKRGIIAALPISPLGKLAALVALKRKEKKKKAKAAKKAAAANAPKRSTTPEPEPAAPSINTFIPSTPYTPPQPAPVFEQQQQYMQTQPQQQQEQQEQEQETEQEQEKPKMNIKKMLPLLAIGAGALYFLTKKK